MPSSPASRTNWIAASSSPRSVQLQDERSVSTLFKTSGGGGWEGLTPIENSTRPFSGHSQAYVAVCIGYFVVVPHHPLSNKSIFLQGRDASCCRFSVCVCVCACVCMQIDLSVLATVDWGSVATWNWQLLLLMFNLAKKKGWEMIFKLSWAHQELSYFSSSSGGLQVQPSYQEVQLSGMKFLLKFSCIRHKEFKDLLPASPPFSLDLARKHW